MIVFVLVDGGKAFQDADRRYLTTWTRALVTDAPFVPDWHAERIL